MDRLTCKGTDGEVRYQEKTHIRFKDENGNLVGDVIEALYREEQDDFVVQGGRKAGSYTWDEVEEVDEDGNILYDYPEDATFCLTPLSCFGLALVDSHITEDDVCDICDDRNFRNAYDILEKWFKENGYVTDSEGNTNSVENPEKPKDLFCKVVNVFYPNSTPDQRDVAWDLFVMNMDKQGNLKADEKED